MLNIDEEYYEWLCSFTKGKRNRGSIKKFDKLLDSLHYYEFIPMMDLDFNRVEDGLSLRWRFSNEFRINYNPEDSCSVLEMMIALALRCEEQIMDDPDIGNRTSHWFWLMVRNMGLFEFNDNNFNSDDVKNIIDRFINREYDEDGHGGLFTIPDCREDLTKVEIWYQMCWYLDTLV